MVETALVVVPLVVGAALWYKLGKLESEVRGHNRRLDKIEEEITSFLRSNRT